ncbi:MAG: hypothetical protein H7A25_17260 [Leptospiraceae bacterium]|nr:hypothetical protein [Leptospiraceae bacterium]MCP5501654.1 hypothetical protein [Leptospiraceae bacterium]
MELIKDIKEGFINLKEGFVGLKESFKEMQTSFQELKLAQKKLEHTLDQFFSFIPLEVFILLLLAVLLLVILNSISPTTVRGNLSISIFLLCALWMYANQLLLKEYRLLKVLHTAAYILVPAYLMELGRLGKWIYKYFRYRKLKPERLQDLPVMTEGIHTSYSKFIISQNRGNFIQFVDSIKDLKMEIEKLEKKLEHPLQ